MSQPEFPLTLYDISSTKGTFAVSPWRARYALMFKHLPIRIVPVVHSDIPSLRSSLGLSYTRTGPTGAPWYTLPVLVDPNTKTTIDDSFSIAEYLDTTYPSKIPLFPPGTIESTRKFNDQAVSCFTFPTTLLNLHGTSNIMPEGTQHETQAIFSTRFSRPWADLCPSTERRVEILAQTKPKLAALIDLHPNLKMGWFHGGSHPTFADFCLGGWIQFARFTWTGEEFEEMCGWFDGAMVRIYDGLKIYEGSCIEPGLYV